MSTPTRRTAVVYGLYAPHESFALFDDALIALMDIPHASGPSEPPRMSEPCSTVTSVSSEVSARGEDIVLICEKCGGNTAVGAAWLCGIDDILTCGDCGLICQDKGGDHNFHNCDGASCFVKYHDLVKDECGGHCWCISCLHADCTDAAACRAQTCTSDPGNACPQYRETGVVCEECVRLDAEVAAEMIAWEMAGKPDFWSLTDGPCPN